MSLTASNGLWVNAGRIALAKSIKAQPIFMAWGTGDDSWEQDGVYSPPNEDIDATGLTNEIGRKALSRSLYVVEDDAGPLSMSTGHFDDDGRLIVKRYSQSDKPTLMLYVQFDYDYSDGGNAQIKEIGIYSGCKLTDEAQAELDAGTRSYFTLNTDFDDPGTLLVLEHLDAINNLSTYTRGFYATVLYF